MNRMQKRPTHPLTKKQIAIFLAVCFFILAALIVTFKIGQYDESMTVRGVLQEFSANQKQIEIDGKTAAYKRNLTNILILGIDQPSGTKTQTTNYRNNGQADFLMLVTLDKEIHQVKFLQLDRDLMTDIKILSVLGQESGTRRAQICLSHSFGATSEQSCQLTVDAVSKFLFGIPIDHYVSINMNEVGKIADYFGGIPVTVMDDFSAVDPTLKKGERVLLKGEQANLFVRQRYGVSDETNQTRMLRHQEFINELIKKLKNESEKGQSAIESMYDALLPFLLTDMSQGRMINLASQARGYSVMPIVTLKGEHRISADGFMEFEADRQDLIRRIQADFVSVLESTAIPH